MPRTELAEDFGGFQNVDPGQYHLVIVEVDGEPKKENGDPIDAGKVKFQVLNGTVKGQEGRTFWDTFWTPRLNDEKKLPAQRQSNLVVAAGLFPESARRTSVEWEWEQLVGKQLCAAVDLRDNKYPQIAWQNMWHVTHKDAIHIPKDGKALGLMGLALDKDGKTVMKATATTKPPANGNDAAKQPAAATVAAGAGGDELDLDQL